ncbi:MULTISPECIES: DUF4886 domain-containing protein [unclassified Polaribacter]|uniref:DUF4886 domain-containing protein n=1 Tax=unclassified Polaribacter TaxID=196858 RepID=UPI0011BEFFD7|nr:MULTISPECIES: DUF4886 domain-containing protein [unclassified Polaribacter]TXD50172.1 hypothetical protein ES043_17010 [Polaribacter sp. IC063]TXD56238.1 hypothetical protein ES044_17170 [Polaribacter sp. IC066]
MKLPTFILKISFSIILFFSIAISAQKKTIKVLFVGNSFTYYNNLPQVVSAMAKTQGLIIETRHSTVGGSTLQNHWKREKGTQTRKMIENETWDFVVFNNHSLSTIKTPKTFLKFSEKFADLVRKKGAEPVFMMTWAYKSNPLMLPTIVKMYNELSELTNSDYVPCGPLFENAIKYRPNLELFHDDKHPSPNGTYLLGLAFYKYFTGKITANIPRNLATLDTNGQKLFLIFTQQKDADFLQQIVDEFPFKTQ